MMTQYLRLFHIIIKGREEGRKMWDGGIFRLFVKSLRGIWQKKLTLIGMRQQLAFLQNKLNDIGVK